MTHPLKPCLALLALALVPVSVEAQSRTERAADVHPPAATTLLGDSGLWYVPSAELLPGGVVNAGVAHASELRNDGATRVRSTVATMAAGVGDRAEIFGGWQMTNRAAGLNAGGSVLAGAKVAVLSQRSGAPLALAVRSAVTIPTGSDSGRVDGGARDVLAEVVAGRQVGRAEVTGATGFVRRGDSSGTDRPNGVRSGVGLGIAAHRSLRLFTELHGEHYLDDVPPTARLLSTFDTPMTAAAGASWQIGPRFVAAAGVSRALRGSEPARGVGAVVRVGYRPLTRRAPAPAPAAEPAARPQAAAVPVAPPAPPAAPAPAAPRNAASASPAIVLAFDDVHFDFDRFTLRPAALPILDKVAAAMTADARLRLRIDGHTCEVGTAEYNLALGERRAEAVRDYLVARGIPAARLQMVSYGEERPKHDLSREATRALNRRAELRVVDRTATE